MQYSIVVGANYGDEGKGLMTDFLVEQMNAKFVARFNGGAQAGHTVVRGDKRHVFGNWSSGTLAGATTILTQDVILNPYAMHKEFDQLKEINVSPGTLYASRRSPITTPFDIAINQAAEMKRAGKRHGSCGLGINETISRTLEMKRVSHESTLLEEPKETFWWIYQNWIEKRMKELNYDFLNGDILDIKRKHDEYLDGFINTMHSAQERFLDFSRPIIDSPVVYEGAQGLALDEFIGDFPYVTRSNTGIANALDHINEIANPAGKHLVTVYYMTRTYLTRHGAGPLTYEMPIKDVIGKDFTDTTNVTNPWQEHLRFAPLNVPELVGRIKKDIKRNLGRLRDYSLSFQPVIVLTCCDQSARVMAIKDVVRGPEHMLTGGLVDAIEGQSGIPVGYLSFGPTAKHVELK